MYYKAGGIPWRLPRDPADVDTCYVGITFYRSIDNQILQTSVAQVFNQRGNGVIVRGATAKVSRNDRQPHLARGDAESLLAEALRRYRGEHGNLPARAVLHRTSSYTPDEITGFRTAADDADITTLEMLWLPASNPVRLFRPA